jgi:hypothetical protein
LPCKCAAYLRRILLELNERSRGVSGIELRRIDKHLSRCGNHPALAVRDSQLVAVVVGELLAKIENPESFVDEIDDDKTPVRRTLIFNDDTVPSAQLPEPPPSRGKR